MCNCTNRDNVFYSDHYKKEMSTIDNKFILDNLGRELLVQSAIHDVYGDIIGYVTKNSQGNTVRIFKKNVKKIID